MLLQLGELLQAVAFGLAAIDTLVNLGSWASERDHKVDEVLCALHMVEMRVSDEDTFDVTIHIRHEFLYVFQELLNVTLSSIHKEPLLASPDGVDVGATEHTDVRVHSRDEVHTPRFIELDVVASLERVEEELLDLVVVANKFEALEVRSVIALVGNSLAQRDSLLLVHLTDSPGVGLRLGLQVLVQRS